MAAIFIETPEFITLNPNPFKIFRGLRICDLGGSKGQIIVDIYLTIHADELVAHLTQMHAKPRQDEQEPERSLEYRGSHGA